MASIRQCGKRWQARVCVKNVKKSKNFSTRSQAESWAEGAERDGVIADEIRLSNDFDLTDMQLRRLYSRTKSNSKLNGIGHFVTYEYFANLWRKSEKRCAISGLIFSDYQPKNSRRKPFSPSIDRIDCSKGYSEGNIRFVCVAANIARSDFPDEILLILAKGICSHAPYAKTFGTWAN